MLQELRLGFGDWFRENFILTGSHENQPLFIVHYLSGSKQNTLHLLSNNAMLIFSHLVCGETEVLSHLFKVTELISIGASIQI